jgi:hypothetical protein
MLKNLSRIVFVCAVVGWIFSGWPQILNNPPFPPMVEKANAAISAVTSRGSAVTGTGNNSSLGRAPTANITVGKIAFFAVATDNESTTDGCGGTLHTLTGSAGNTWTKLLECTETDGGSDDGVTISLFATKVTTQISTSDTVTVSFNTSRSDIIVMLFEATVGAGNTLEVAQIGQGQATLTAAVSGLVSQSYLLLYLAGAEGEDNSKSPTTNYTELFDLLTTTSGPLDTNISAYVQTRIATLTSSSALPTAWTFTNPFSSLTALFEESLPTLSIAQPDGTGDTVNVGDSYNITYTLADTDDVVTAAFYYDTNNTGLDGTAITGACATAAEGTGTTCSWDTTGITPGSYYVYGVVTGDGGIGGGVSAYSSGQITINAPNSAPTLSIAQPDGTGDTVNVGDSYNITYTLADTDDVVTAAFYYDTNNTGLDGTAITGACATAAEGTGATCSWDTTGVTPGSYYVYGITNDGTNPDVSAYSSGQITINAAAVYSVSITSSGLIEYGFVQIGTASSTVGNGYTQTAQNDGNTTETLNVKSSDATNGTGWTLASSIDTNIFKHEFSTTTGSRWDVMPDNATYVTAAPSVAQSGTVNFDFRLTTPSASTDYVQKSITITVQAVAP